MLSLSLPTLTGPLLGLANMTEKSVFFSLPSGSLITLMSHNIRHPHNQAFNSTAIHALRTALGRVLPKNRMPPAALRHPRLGQRLLAACAVAFLNVCAVAQNSLPPQHMSWLENETIKLGIDLSMGGAITSLAAKADGRELVNNFDHGRQIQMAFYSGPVPFAPKGKQPHPAWRALGWNPVQSGDWAGNPSKVLEHSNDGSRMYTRLVPMQWALEKEPADCELESWAHLEGNVVFLRYRIKSLRPEKVLYSARHQEIPAVYTTGAFSRVMTYAGDAPFTGGPLSQWLDPGPPWRSFSATENWAALVDTKGWGLGVWQPLSTYWKSGYVPGEAGKFGVRDNATGYLAPIALEQMDHNIVYEYSTRLIVGSVNAIRNTVEGWEKGRELPVYRFDRDRSGWTVRGGTDEGFPLTGAWRITAQSATLFVDSPAIFWRADKATTLKVNASVQSDSGRLRVAWKSFRAEEPEASAVFSIPTRGARTEHSFTLKGQPNYQGGLQKLMLRFEGLKSGDSIEIESIRLSQ